MVISNNSYIEQKQPASARSSNFAEFEARIFLWNRPYKRKNASEIKITTQINVFTLNYFGFESFYFSYLS